MVTLRLATSLDALLLYGWAMDPSTRSVSSDPGVFSYESHQQWIARRLNDPATRILIAVEGDRPVGQIRVQRDSDRAEVSISVDAQDRGRGYGGQMLDLVERIASAELGVTTLVGHVLMANEHSRRLFEAAGYTLAATVTIRERLFLRYEKRITAR